MFNIILVCALLSGIGYIVYRVVTRYRASTGTVWQRLLATAKGSATVLWQYVIAIGGMITIAGSKISVITDTPEIKQFMTDYLPPEVTGSIMLVAAIVTIIARLRNMTGADDVRENERPAWKELDPSIKDN